MIIKLVRCGSTTQIRWYCLGSLLVLSSPTCPLRVSVHGLFFVLLLGENKIPNGRCARIVLERSLQMYESKDLATHP